MAVSLEACFSQAKPRENLGCHGTQKGPFTPRMTTIAITITIKLKIRVKVRKVKRRQ